MASRPLVIVRPRTISATPKVRFLLDSKYSDDEDRELLLIEDPNLSKLNQTNGLVGEEESGSDIRGQSSPKSCHFSFRDILEGLECNSSSVVETSLRDQAAHRSLDEPVDSAESVILNPIDEESRRDFGTTRSTDLQRDVDFQIFMDQSSSNSGSGSLTNLHHGGVQQLSPILQSDDQGLYYTGIGRVSWPDAEDDGSESDDEEAPTFLTPMDLRDRNSMMGLPVLGIQRQGASSNTEAQDAVEIVRYPKPRQPPPEYLEVSEEGSF